MLILGGSLSSKSGHELVPLHELITDKEAKELLKNMNLDAANLPRIFSTDPQAVKLGARTGQIIKILRHFENTTLPYYRVVVEG